LVEERFGEETWSLGNTKVNMSAAALIESSQEIAVFLRSEVLVEGAAKLRNH
jgi:hypothetical protein